MSINRDFTGVFIPAHIWLSTEVKAMEKLLLAEIIALSQRTGWCYATRKHFAQWMDCTETNVTNYLSRLVKMGYIEQVERPGQPTLRRVNNQMFYGQQEPIEITISQQKGSAQLTTGVSHSDPQGSATVTPINTSNKYKIKREETPSLQAHQISPVTTSETLSDLKEESAAGQRAGAALLGANGGQREAYRTDSELRIIMAAYYKANPNEYAVGILNDAKGSRLTKEQITNCMVMWSSHMIENSKYNYSAHQLHQAFKRWVLRETQYLKQNPVTKAGPDAAPESVTLKTKNFNFQ